MRGMSIDDLTKLIIPEQFGTDDEDYGDTLDCIKDQIDDCDYAYGVSKFVIFINDFFVAKIPFNGEFHWNYEIEEYDFEEFTRVTDYCEKEAYLYDKAKEWGIAEFFASMKLEGYTKDHTPFYLSERIDKVLENVWGDLEISEEKIRTAREYANSKKDFCWRRLSESWLALALERYEKEKVDKFIDFINKFDINDLHAGNVGFRANGDPVLIDYSGWSE